jgi:hypothetical protein
MTIIVVIAIPNFRVKAFLRLYIALKLKVRFIYMKTYALPF